MNLKNLVYIFSCFLVLVLNACDTGEHDYTYTLINNAEQHSPIKVVYQVLDEKADTVILTYGDKLKLANRIEVPGKKVWDIETSINLYKIKSIQIFSRDSSHISEELAYRKLWTGPEDINGTGAYQLIIEDSIISLSKQIGYTYVITNTFDDTISVISDMTGQARHRDTIVGKQNFVIGNTDIYTFDENLKDSPKYKTQKLKWLTGLTIRHNDKSRTINMSKDTVFFKTEKDTCFFTVSDQIFK